MKWAVVLPFLFISCSGKHIHPARHRRDNENSRLSTSTGLVLSATTTEPVSAPTTPPSLTDHISSSSLNHLTATSSKPFPTISYNQTSGHPHQNHTSDDGTKGVFAHFMVGNCKTWSEPKWIKEMLLAKSVKIDAFAMNIANNDGTSEALKKAFLAADRVGFRLFFSFDYAGNGPWSKEDVKALLSLYQKRASYFKYKGAPFVSTFEGPGNAYDWIDIKASTGCFFMPDWSSQGAFGALSLANGVADGLFSWAPWPWGNQDMDTYVDASYRDALGQAGGKPYMMAVSPWFYTNLPGFGKNWLWRGDDLWRDRWEEVLFVQPEFVQIISWNDYGESHYVGPLHDDGYEAFEPQLGNPPFNYVLDMPHSGWLTHLPFSIDMYKHGISSVTQESLVTWYRLYPAASGACSSGETTGNTANQLQLEFPLSQVSQDKIFYSISLTREATVSVTVGGVEIAADWTNKPWDGVGIWHGSAAYGSLLGAVKVTISRNGAVIAQVAGRDISTTCTSGFANWNAWVGSDPGHTVAAVQPTLKLEEQACIRGTGAGNFAGVCGFTCSYGYCPLSACVCKEMGKGREFPPSTGVQGYPAAGLGSSYIGLCSFTCNFGYCPAGTCSTTQSPLIEPSSSPFNPPYCTGGTGPGQLAGLCSYSCNFGYCPSNACTCTSTGPLNYPPGSDGSQAYLTDGSKDYGLCSFTCSRGYCPDICTRR